MIGAEFEDPHGAPKQPMHEQLASTLTSKGIHSKHGHEHFLNTVRSPGPDCTMYCSQKSFAPAYCSSISPLAK